MEEESTQMIVDRSGSGTNGGARRYGVGLADHNTTMARVAANVERNVSRIEASRENGDPIGLQCGASPTQTCGAEGRQAIPDLFARARKA
jgi:hypothetical protein